MIEYVTYDTADGRITSFGAVDAELSELQAAWSPIGVAEGAGAPDTHYVSGGVVTARPTLSASIDKAAVQADGFDTATITGIPAGWSYEISNGEAGTTVGGDIELTALEAGTFTLRFTNWPYQDVEYTLIASATPLASTDAPVGTPWRLHSNPAVTLAEMKTAAKHEMHVLDDEFLARELEFLGCSRATFDVRAAEAVAYAAAAYPDPPDSGTYPYIALEAEITSQTGTVVADAILALKSQYDLTVEFTERARRTAFWLIDNCGYVETCAREQFNWRHAFSLSAVMGATLDLSYVDPAPNPDYPTVDIAGDGVAELTITLPEKSLPQDMEVIVEAYEYGGGPWAGATLDTYTNPGDELVLTFTDPTDPAYAASDIQWLVTIRNLPRVNQQFLVNSTTA